MRRRRKAALCSVLLFWLFCSGMARGESLKLVAFQYPPLVYQQQGAVTGIATRIVRAVFSDLGIDIDIEILPWPRALQYLEHGQADGVFTIFRNPRREQYLLYPDQPLIVQTISLYANNDSPVQFSGQLAELQPYRIGITRAVSYGRRFDRAARETLSGITVVNDEESKFMLLARRRVDLVVSSTGIADFYLNRLGLQDQISRIPVVIERVPSYLAFSRKSSGNRLMKQFEAALQRLKQSGRYEQIADQYYQPASDR